MGVLRALSSAVKTFFSEKVFNVKQSAVRSTVCSRFEKLPRNKRSIKFAKMFNLQTKKKTRKLSARRSDLIGEFSSKPRQNKMNKKKQQKSS